MANVPGSVLIPGTGQLFLAPDGTALPVDVDEALDAAFTDLGFLHEQGATFSDGKTPGTPIFTWQRRAPIRMTVGNAEPYLELMLREWNEDTLAVAFGGGSVSTTTNGFAFVPSVTGATVRRALVLEMSDGDVDYRLTAGAAEVHAATQVNLNRADSSALTVRFELLTPADDSAPWDILTDATQFASTP